MTRFWWVEAVISSLVSGRQRGFRPLWNAPGILHALPIVPCGAGSQILADLVGSDGALRVLWRESQCSVLQVLILGSCEAIGLPAQLVAGGISPRVPLRH
jgi:hypothetical protein